MPDKILTLSFRQVMAMLLQIFQPVPEYRAFYDWFALATPIRQVEPDWYLLKWEPVKGATYGLYLIRESRHAPPLLRAYECGAHNGWGRGYEQAVIEVSLPFGRMLCFWIRWRIIVHKDGPMDWPDRIPLDLTKYKPETEKP